MSNPTEKPKKNKVNLSKALIIETSLNMIETHGIDGFSLRKLAQQLNCEAMSIYYHIKNKEQILDEIVDHLIAQINFQNHSDHIKAQLTHIARQWREISQHYPNFFPILAVHPLNTAVGNHFMNQILSVFQHAGFVSKDASYFLRILNYYLIGVGIDEAKGYHSNHQPQVEPETLDNNLLLQNEKSYWTKEDQDQIFELGLNMLLEGMLKLHVK